MSQKKRNAFIFILSLLILSTFGQLIAQEYFYRSMNDDERRKFIMQNNEEPISIGPSTIEDILPKERDLTTFIDILRKFSDTLDMIANPNLSLTIFAPTNSAFRKLTFKPSQVKDRSEDPTEKLHRFALGHIVPLAYLSLPDDKEIDTLRNTSIKVERNYDGTFKLNGRANTISSIKAETNGIVYKIDGALED